MPNNNLIFLIVDALSSDDINFVRNNSDFPGFNELIKKSTLFNNASSVAPVTEMVLPSIFTSKLPLNENGYENGIIDVKKNLINILKDNSYFTKIFSSCSILSELYGYVDSDNEVIPHYSIEGPWKTFTKTYIQHFVKESNKPFLNKDYVKYVIEKHYKFFLNFIKKDKDFFTKKISKLNSQKKEKIIERINLHLKILSHDPIKYLEKYGKDIIKNSLTSFFYKKSLNERAYDIFEKVFKPTHSSKSPAINIPIINYEIGSPSHENSSESVFKSINLHLDQVSGKKFAFIAHFMDIHDRNYSCNRIFKNKTKKNIQINNNNLKSFEGLRKLSLKFFDNFLFEFLEKNKDKLKNTLIVLSSDHGKVFADNDSALNNKKLCGSFQEDYLRIPFLFYNQNQNFRKIENLISSIDLLPTLIEILDLKSPNLETLGINAFKKKDDVVFAEHRFRGPDLLNKKKGINYYCVKNRDFKYIYKEKLHTQDKVEDKEILVNYKTDISETINIIKNPDFQKILFSLKEKLKLRMDNLNKF